jgi:hypothetical protein
MTSDPVRLTVVYERAENGWTTATIPAVPGTIRPEPRPRP